MIDFNDLIPTTKPKPGGVGVIDFEDLIPTSQPVQEEPEPTSEDLETYRRMGLKQYTSPSGKRYPLTQPTETEKQKPIGIGLGPMWDEPGDTRTMRERLGHEKKKPVSVGIPEIFKGIREMIAPTTEYTKEEWERQLRETPEKILWSLKYMPTLGGRLGGKDFRKRLLEQAEEFAGFGPALGPAVSESAVLALEWGLIYPALFRAVGMGGEAISKIPRVAKAGAAIKKMGGLEKVAEKFPRAYARAVNVAKAMGKGAGVGGFMAGVESIGKDMEPGEVLQHVGKRAALMAGVAGTFQAVSEIDTALYTRSLRNTLIRSSNREFDRLLATVEAMPKTAAKSAAYRSLTSLKRVELKAIDRIVSSAEAQLLGIKKGKIYQLGQETVERPERAAQRLMKFGLDKVGELPRGVEALKKGLGKTEPFIKMPMTRVAEAIETSRQIGQTLKVPSLIAKRIAERVKIPKPPAKITPRPITTRPEIKAPEAEKPPTEKVREPTEHLVALPKAKGAREIEPAKGETILIENPEQKGDYQKYEDFGTGILRKGNKLYHKTSLMQIENFSTVKNARKAAQTLAQEDIDFELEDVEKIRTQFQQWRTEKGDIDIEAYLIGKGKELEGEDYPEIIRTMAWVREKDAIISKLKGFVSEVPEFTLSPVLTYKEGYLVFSDGYRFKFIPDYFGINKESLVEGDKIRFDLESLGIKKPSAKKLKAAEIWTGEPKIMGREAEKPIPVERRRKEVKPRKLTAKEETYERALTDIETGEEVEVEGGVTYKAVREDDIRRVAELGRKAGRQAWTVERDILSRQERGTAETKMDIGEAIKIIRDVFSAQPPAEPQKAGSAIGDTVKIVAKPSTAHLTNAAGKTGKVVDIQMIRGRPSSWAVDIAGEEYIVDDLKDLEPKAPEKIEPLKSYHAEVELPNKEKAAFDYQYIEYPKTGQHEYGFNFHNKTIGHPNTGIIHHSAKATEVDSKGGPIEYARQWAAKRYAEVQAEPEAVEVAAKPKTLKEIAAEAEAARARGELTEGQKAELRIELGKLLTEKAEGIQYHKAAVKFYPENLEQVEKHQAEVDARIKEIRNLLGEAPTEAVEVAPEKIIHKIRKMTPEEIAEDEAFWANFDKIKKAVHVPTVEALSDTLGKRIDLLKKVQLGILTQQEADTLTEKFVEAAKLRIEAQPVAKAEATFVPPTKPKLSFEDLIPTPIDVKHIQNVVVDTFQEWPKGIKKVGKDYWTEVMAVAKQLATPYRYKALRQTMLGVFRFKKKPVPQVVGIEIQDITDALTATHELAHNIDWLLNNKIFPSSIKARFPDATVGEISLRNELKKISQVLRPDMWERPKAYIKRHTELMADFISHYILDPEKTRELAPNLTRAFEAKLAAKPELFDTISRLQESRYTGPEEPPIAKHIREVFPLPKEFTPLKLAVDMTKDSYVKAAEELGITAVRHYKLLIQRAQKEADRIDELVPNKNRQTDLVVLAEAGSKNPWTGKTRQEILKEGLTAGERKAIKLFRAYQEKARQTVNKYLRGADIAEYIKFIEDYFIHAYQTSLTEKYKTAIARWAKRSPQAKKRILPDLAKSVEIGLKPRAKTLSEGLKLWAGINYRVMTNKAFLRVLPQITNDDGVSILQKPQDYPHWPTVDYWPIRQNYAVPLPNRGVLLFQGRVAVDPRVKPFIDAMFGRKVFNTPVRIIEGLNATWKAFELTLFSFFHHQAEFFSAAGSLGPRALPFVGGYYGKRAQVFGKKKLFGFLPTHIATLKAGKQLEKTPEFMDDYLAHGGQRGYISTEGINLMERSLKRAADYLEGLVQREPTTPLTGVFAAAYVPVRAAQEAYSFHQSVLWDNVNRAKLVSYYNIVADGAKNSDLPIKDVKETAVKYINDNFGGQEWLNTMFRNRKTRQFWTQLMMSLDWTWSQIKTARWPFAYGGKSKAEKARRALMRRIGRRHWFWYISAIAGFTIAGSYAMSGKGPWENERGHKLDIDWTNIWRSLPWNRDWKERGDYSRRYIGLGKAGRELVRWVTSPLRAFGYKLSPVARSMFEQTTGYNVGSNWAEPWAREDLQLYQEIYARFKHLMENFKPFAFSGNNAFLAFPSRKGMTQWKATRAYEDIYKAQAIIAMGGIGGKIAKANQILKKDEQKLRTDIEEACKLNNVDMNQADRAALAGVRSKYYSLFWKATKMPEKQAVKLCNDYADALLELGVTPKGFKQSLRYRAYELPEKSKEIGVQHFYEAAQKRR